MCVTPAQPEAAVPPEGVVPFFRHIRLPVKKPRGMRLLPEKRDHRLGTGLYVRDTMDSNLCGGSIFREKFGYTPWARRASIGSAQSGVKLRIEQSWLVAFLLCFQKRYESHVLGIC